MELTTKMVHLPVMAKEVIEVLEVKPEGIYVDLTLGRAGHAKEILKKITTGKLIGFDKDIVAIKESKKLLNKINPNFQLFHKDFKYIKQTLNDLNLEKVDGIIADLGVSSPQFDDPLRGFSYNKDAKLDMRMDQTNNFDASQIVNNWTVLEISHILKSYADVKLSLRVANAIVKSRPIFSTVQLTDIIRDSLPSKVLREKNVVRQVFQALRIAVNDEINSLKIMLKDAISLLKPLGKLAIITFHSIEDRIVKQTFAYLIKNKTGKIPIIESKEFVLKTYKPTSQEVANNRRARSAKLRVLTKV